MLQSESSPLSNGDHRLNSMPQGVEVLLTTKEASQVLKIHPKVLERMAKRGEVPALKVGKFWRYRATTLRHGAVVRQYVAVEGIKRRIVDVGGEHALGQIIEDHDSRA